MPTKTHTDDDTRFYWFPESHPDYEDEDDRIIAAVCLLLIETVCWLAWLF